MVSKHFLCLHVRRVVARHDPAAVSVGVAVRDCVRARGPGGMAELTTYGRCSRPWSVVAAQLNRAAWRDECAVAYRCKHDRFRDSCRRRWFRSCRYAGSTGHQAGGVAARRSDDYAVGSPWLPSSLPPPHPEIYLALPLPTRARFCPAHCVRSSRRK